MRPKLTFANVMSVIAVFIALGGTAAALRANSVGSRAIKNETVKSSDLRDGRVKGRDLAEGAVSARELGEGVLGEIPGVLMKDDARACDPNSTVFVNCGSLFLNVGERSQALLIAGGEQYGDADADGRCRFRADGLFCWEPPHHHSGRRRMVVNRFKRTDSG